MKTAFTTRTWLAMLLAGIFALAHGVPVRPRLLTVERPRLARPPVFRRPLPGTC